VKAVPADHQPVRRIPLIAGACSTSRGRYYRARYYHPGLQRFISEDPVGLLGGWNHHEYVRSNPLRFVDPRGLTRLEFNVLRGTLTVDPERFGEEPHIIPATSGIAKCMDETKCEAIRGRGPVPRGAYFILAEETDQPSALWAPGRSLRADWGSFRVPIHLWTGNAGARPGPQ
jgi:hypothetical protein